MVPRLCLALLILTASGNASSASNESARPAPLGVQTCDTQCQSDKTDCELACDQVVSCVEECKRVAVACVEQCRIAPPPEKVPPAKKAPAPVKAPKGKKTH
ncbi:MAG TPA: hypothetical protein VGI10_25770 [Polyangiaceae bacterium]|jgi:hypothetical protein